MRNFTPGVGALVVRPSRLSQLAAVLFLTGVLTLTSSLCAQTRPATDDANNRRRGGGTQDDANGRRGGSPEEMQARMLAGMRDRFEVTDDEEWKLVSERLTKVMELRRSAAGAAFGGFGNFGGRGGPPGGGSNADTSNRGTRTRGTTGGNTEIAALSAAVRDKLPDAEVKSRLDRVREVRKDNEAKLAKAQEELRAVLSVRQEAMAVVFGLLP